LLMSPDESGTLLQETGISLTGQRLVHKGEVLRHGTLSDYGVTPLDPLSHPGTLFLHA
jgi:hypothetical protein